MPASGTGLSLPAETHSPSSRGDGPHHCDSPLARPHGSSVGYARPLFSLINDAGQACAFREHTTCLDWSADVMRVRAVDYTGGRRFL